MTKIVEYFKSLGFPDDALKDITAFDPTTSENTGLIINHYAKNPQISALHSSQTAAAHFNKLKSNINDFVSDLDETDEVKKAALTATNFDDGLGYLKKVLDTKIAKAKAASGVPADFEKQKGELIKSATSEMQKQINSYQKENKELGGKYVNLVKKTILQPIISNFLNNSLETDATKAAHQKNQRAGIIMEALNNRVDVVVGDNDTLTYIDKKTSLPAMDGTQLFNVENFIKNEAENLGWYTPHQKAAITNMGGGYQAPNGNNLDDNLFKQKRFNT